LYEALRPGGFVCLGHSESMSRITPLFTLRRFPDAIVYQKPKA
jgi:chemotaxis protein methyltransferase CheR